MNGMHLAFVGESGKGEGPRFKCNICGSRAEFVVQLELAKSSKKYTRQMPFYLCKSHEYVYKKMQSSIELKDYFSETIQENQ
jgi:hypothetical protein